MTNAETLASIVGAENLLESEDALKEHSRDSSFVPRMRPRSVVKAGNAKDVQAIVRWANKTRTPLVPISSGAPHSHGDTVPSVGGAVIIDLSEMKKIIRIDRRNRVVMVEPGVTFSELVPALKKEGLVPLTPLVPRSSKSVVTAFLERTPITAPGFHWEAQDPLSCVEVVYGCGDLMRTGSAAGPGSLEEQWEVGRAQMRGMGPSQIDFTRLLQGAQGTMGIVTWATIRCRPFPKIKKMFLIPSEDLEPLIDMSYRILYKKLGEELLILNGFNLASILGKDREEIGMLNAKLPSWILLFGIDGAGLLPEEKTAYQTEESVEIAQACGLELKTSVPGTTAEGVSAALSQPCADAGWKHKGETGCGDVFFLTTLDRCRQFVDAAYRLAGKFRFSSKNLGVYIQPMVQGTNCHLEFSLSYDTHDRQEADKARRFVEGGGETFANMGAFFSRPYGSWARIAYGREAQAVIAQKKLKCIFDPNGVMNPGKLCF
jgi:FAD/FMN-containing dehydrogenase